MQNKIIGGGNFECGCGRAEFENGSTKIKWCKEHSGIGKEEIEESD